MDHGTEYLGISLKIPTERGTSSEKVERAYSVIQSDTCSLSKRISSPGCRTEAKGIRLISEEN